MKPARNPKAAPLPLTVGLTPAQIDHIPFAIREGIADPDDARALLAWYCHFVDYGLPIPPTTLEHLRAAFSAYLDGSKTLPAALGLNRKRARPTADPAIRLEMAVAVVRLRLAGSAPLDALEAVAEQFGCERTTVGNALLGNRVNAIATIRDERPPGDDPWTVAEKPILRGILRRDPWFGTAPRK